MSNSRIISVFLSLAMVALVSGAIAPTASAITIADIQAQILALQAQLTALQGTPTTGYTFSADLKLGSTGDAVKQLQMMLNKDAATQVAASGVGSSGSETTYFGALTKAAVIKFQTKYAADVLTPLGLTAGTGYVGAATRAKLNTMGGVAVTPTTPTTPTIPGVTPVIPQGTGLTVTAGVQPTASIAPYGASRIPFTVVNFTASADGDVTVNSIVVERTGLATDITLSGIILLDETNQQLGLEKTLNSLHQVTLSEPFTVKAGTTRAMVLAANRPTAATAHGGEIAYLSLVAVNTSATVNGALPITGTGQTINETLVLGSVTMARGSLDPGADAASKEIGTTGYTFSGVRMTAGSGENIRLLSIRWYQSGSAAVGDLANVKTYVDGVAYGTVLSSDSKYYTTTFDGGIVIEKGFNKEASIKADIAGGSARTITFDIYKATDIYLKGETYGYGITPPTGSETGDGKFTATQPWYNAYDVTVSAGTINVSKATAVESQNIAINLANQPLGGFIVDVKGEAISVASMTFRLSEWDGTGGTTYTQCVTGVSMYDENGKVVAGPADITASSPNLAFADTVTFPVGAHAYTLKGKLVSEFANNQTVAASTTPASDWGTVRGSVTGVTITPTGGTITGNAMTVKSASLAVSVSSMPLQQTVIAGVSQFNFANYVLNAGSSGEDVALNSMYLEYNASANPTKITSCKLYDGSTVLTTGSNIYNPTAAASSTTFALDNPLTITKGTSKTIALKCDIAGNATAEDFYYWGLNNTTANALWSATGKISGQSLTAALLNMTFTLATGQKMTVAAAGAYTVANDSTPGYSNVAAGATGVTLLKLKFAATTEPIDIYRVAFQLTTNASNTPDDLVGNKVTLWDGAKEIGEAAFSIGDYATSTLISAGAFRIPAGSSKTMTVKGDIAAISGTIGPLIKSGDLLIVSYDANDRSTSAPSSSGNYGKGTSSGTSVTSGTTSDVSPSGVRILKTYPTFAKVDLSTSERILQTKSAATLYKFKVTANSSGDVYINKFSFTIASSTGSAYANATVSNLGLYVFTDSSYSLTDTAYSATGIVNYYTRYTDGQKTGWAPFEAFAEKQDVATSSSLYKVPASETRWFELRGDIAGVETTSSVSEYITVKLTGDAVWPIGHMNPTAIIEVDAEDDFIWSPNSTSTTATGGDLDFTNGYGLGGLPANDMPLETIQSTN